MQAEADDTVIVRVERPGGVFAQHGSKASMIGFQGWPSCGPARSSARFQPGRARIDRGRLHRKPIVELLFPLLSLIGASHPDRELRVAPAVSGWAGPTASDDGPQILRPKMAATRSGPAAERPKHVVLQVMAAVDSETPSLNPTISSATTRPLTVARTGPAMASTCARKRASFTWLGCPADPSWPAAA